VSVFVAAAPVVGRIRLLTEEVLRSAESRYEQPVQVGGKDEIAQLARAFNDAGAGVRAQICRVEEREKALRAFLADTTHDLMIPLTVLQGHLDHLQKAPVGGGAESSVLVSAIQEAHYVGSLVHNLAAAAKLEGGETLVEFHAVDLGAVVERVVERHRPVAKPSEIIIDFVVPERPLIVQGDVTLIEQAVSNLVHNAVRYNRRGGHVAVILEEAPPGFWLEVIDDGPGISRYDLKRVFQRRERGDHARQRRPEGLGLGLHIARSVVERHGFDIRLDSVAGGGVHVAITGRIGSPP
jgi:two-component system, OmpR family, sensor histidine kinase BaeS